MKLHLPVKLFRAVLACMAAVSFVSFTTASSACLAATAEEEEENELLMLLSEPEYPNGSIIYTTSQTSALTLTGYESILFKDINSSSHGGAIFNDGASAFTLSGNGDVSFSDNTASSSGGAIYNIGNFSLRNSGNVTFYGNEAPYGGAIYNGSNSTFTLSGNERVSFIENTAKYGDAIYNEGTFTMSDNLVVTFSGNGNASALHNTGTFTMSGNGSVNFSDGGGIQNNGKGSFTLSGNGNVSFIGNSGTQYGSVIYSLVDCTFTMRGNENVICSGNVSDYYSRGAIAIAGVFTLSGNGNVTFEKNYSYYDEHLISIYSFGIGTAILNFSASEGRYIMFKDSVYARSGTVAVNLNQEGKGDIIFTGATAADDLLEMKGMAGTSAEILRSQHSQLHTDVALGGGSLHVLDEAKLTLHSLTVGTASQAASIQIHGGWIDAARQLTLSDGSSISLSDCNYLLSSGITAEGHNTLNIQLGDFPQQAPALTVAGALANAGNLVVNMGNVSGLTGNNYHILHVIGDSESWKNAVLQFTGADAFTWVGGDLYYRYNADLLSTPPRTDKIITERLCIEGFEMLTMNKTLVFDGASSGITSSLKPGDYIVIIDNDAVIFSGNTGSTFSSDEYYPYGASISNSDATFTMSYNGAVTFTSVQSERCVINNFGSTFTMSNNGAVTISGNSVFAEFGYGVIYNEAGATFMLSHNGNVTFSENSVTSTKLSGGGGAIYNRGTFTLSGNEDVTFSGNIYSAAASYGNSYGGAIRNDVDYTFTLSGNGNVFFEKNAVVSNGSFLLRSIYSKGTLNLASLEGKSIIFRDSLYASGTVNLNQDYTDSEGVVHKSTGDIILTGATAEADLREVKGGVDGTAEEILNSRTSEIATMTKLYGGRLIVEDKAILKGQGITAFADSGATVRVKDGSLDHSGYALTFNNSTTLEAEGVNAVTADSVDMLAGSTLSFVLGESNLTTAALTLTGTLTTETISIAISGLDDLEAGNYTYALLSATTYDTSAWTADKITVVTDGVSFDDLVWDNGTLYLNYSTLPNLTTATWNNASGDGLWNASSLNWTQDGHSYAYADGVDVIFGNEGAGTVSLVGDLAPKSVLINNSSGFDYTFAGTGKLTGVTALTKQGAGKLTINTANDYTGGTAINGGTLVVGNAAALGTGAVAVNGGTLEIAANGFANDTSFAGTSALVVDAGYQLALSKMLANSGVLTVSGTLNASSLTLNTTAATHVDVNGNSGASGFAKGALYSVQVVNGGTTSGSAATITHLNLPTGETLVLGSDGIATAGGAINYSEYLLTGSDTVSSSAIHGVEGAANATVTQNGGTLTVDDTVTVNGTGGAITLNGGALNGSLQGMTIDAVQGTLAATLTGNNTLIGHDFALNAPLDNQGTLVLNGTFDLSGMTPTTTAPTHIDVNGNSGASGFAKTELQEVTIATGGTINASGATFTHNGNTLTLGEGGVASVGGTIDYSNYLLTGSDTASSSAIHGVEGAANAMVTQTGGTLTVDDTVTVATTAGTIVLNGGTLNGTVSGATINAASGALNATLSGNNTLNGNNYALGSVIDNSGTLTFSGTFDASALTLDTTAATHIDVNGNSGANGFAKDAFYAVTLATGTTVNAGATITHGSHTLTLGADGIATAGGAIDYSNYLLTGSGTASASAIHGVEGAANATVTQNGGTLTVDDTVTAATTGGTIALNGGTLNGTVSGATINAVSGALNAALSGENTLNGNNYALGGVIDNSGTLTISGTFDVSALTLNTTAATHIDVNGNSGANGFAKDAFYAVTLATGTTVNAGATITHGSHTLTLGADGMATAGGAVDYGTYFLHNGAEVAVSAIRSVPEAADAMVDMDGGLLDADADVFVKATGGRIEVSHGANVAGSIRDTQIAIHGCEISADITGNSSVYVDGDTILSGHNTYTGNTDVVDGGMLKVTGSVTADIYLHGGMLDTATGMTLVSGQDIFFRGGQVKGNLRTVSGSGMHLAQSSMVNGSVTLGGGTLTLSNGATLHVTGSLTLAAPTQLVGDWQQNQTYTLISTNGGVNADGVADLNSFFGVEESVGTVKVGVKDVVLITIMEAVEETVTPDAVDKGMVNASWAALATVRDFARVAGSQRHKLLEGNAFVWGSGFGSFMKVNSTDGFSNSTTGYAAGVQYGLTGETRIGAAIGQSDGQFKTKFHREGTQIDQKGLFGAVTLQHEEQVCATGDVLVDVFAAYGHVKNEGKLNGQHAAGRADWTDHVLNIGGRLSYAQTVDTNVWVIPFVGLEWLYGKQGSTDTTDGRRYEGDAASVLRLPVGITLRASYETEGGSYVVPEVTFGYEGDLVQHNPKAQVRNGGKEYTTEGYTPARSQWMMNVGLNVYFDAHWSAGAGYTLESRPHALNQNANVSVRYAF